MESNRKCKVHRFCPARSDCNNMAHGIVTSYKMYSVSSQTRYGNFTSNIFHTSVIRRPFSSTLVCTSKIHQFVRSSWPVISTKIIEEALPITFVYFVSHTSAQASRSITFTQRFRTTWHLFSIQLLWKPKILNEEDKRTKFEQSTGDLGQFAELCKWHERNWASTRICIVFNMLVDEN